MNTVLCEGNTPACTIGGDEPQQPCVVSLGYCLYSTKLSSCGTERETVSQRWPADDCERLRTASRGAILHLRTGDCFNCRETAGCNEICRGPRRAPRGGPRDCVNFARVGTGFGAPGGNREMQDDKILFPARDLQPPLHKHTHAHIHTCTLLYTYS